MLAQFQSLYPTGSLTTELVQIYNGKYIVRSSVQIESVTRATGMAAAETIEEAEDRSRTRALMVLAMNGEEPQAKAQQKEVVASSKPSLQVLSNRSLTTAVAGVNEHPTKSANSPEVTQTPVSNTPATNSPEVTQTPVSSTPATNSPEVTQTPVSNTPATNSTEVTQTPVSSTPATNSSEVTQTPVSNTPSISSTEVTQTSDVSPTAEIFSAEDNSDIYSQDFDKPLPIPTYDEPEFDAPVENTDMASDNQPEEEDLTPSKVTPLDISSARKTTKKTTKTSTTKRKKKTEPIDLSDVIAKTDVEMERLGWTPQQGREYLIQTYGKRGRTLLTEEELLDFLQYLESQPTQTELSETDPLAGF